MLMVNKDIGTKYEWGGITQKGFLWPESVSYQNKATFRPLFRFFLLKQKKKKKKKSPNSRCYTKRRMTLAQAIGDLFAWHPILPFFLKDFLHVEICDTFGKLTSLISCCKMEASVAKTNLEIFLLSPQNKVPGNKGEGCKGHLHQVY